MAERVRHLVSRRKSARYHRLTSFSRGRGKSFVGRWQLFFHVCETETRSQATHLIQDPHPAMKQFRKILVATDTRLESHPIVDEAADIAVHNGATLKVVDVVPDFPWMVRLTMKDHQHVRELMRDEKQEKLDELAARIREQGVTVETQVLMGKTSVEIIREVLRGNYDLVLRVNKGKDSRRQGFFGNTGMLLLRQCPCAVWLVTAEKTQFQHVLGCVDTSSEDETDSELNDNVFDLAESISQYHGGAFSILHTWSVWNAQFLRRRMSEEEFDAIVQRSHDQVKSRFDRFLGQHGSSWHAENVHLIEGEPPLAIPSYARDTHVDLVVMGTIARSGISGMVMGNTAEQILSSIECSVLALKPANFISPIQLEQ